MVITDLGMPHTDGRAVPVAIKAAAPVTTVIMLTLWGQRPSIYDRRLSRLDGWRPDAVYSRVRIGVQDGPGPQI